MSFISARVLHLYYLTVHTLWFSKTLLWLATLTRALVGVTAGGDGSIEFFKSVSYRYFSDTDNICGTDILSLRFYRANAAMLRIAQ